MSPFTSTKPRVFILLTCAIFLAGCAPASPTTPTALPETATFTPLPTLTWTPLPSLTPTASPSPLPTGTPTPSPTPTPHYDLHDIATWPEAMCAYYQRDPSEWNNPTQEYMSDSEFHSGLITMRRAFMTEQGVTEAETMSEQELFYDYVRWGMENKQILTLSPHELRAMLANPANVAVAYKEINGSERIVHEGLCSLCGLQTNMPGSQFQELLQQWQETRITFSVFGEQITLPRMAYKGFIGNQAGLFRLPGVEPEQGVGILGHWNPSPGQHAWIPLATHFSEHQYYIGDISISDDAVWIIQYDVTMVGAHTGPLGNESGWLVLQQLIDNIGQKIHAMRDAACPTRNFCISGGFPWQFGLEGAQWFDFPNSPTSLALFPPTQYPWTP